MVERSPYLQAALARSPAAYFEDLLSLSPLQLAGLLFGLLSLLTILRSLLQAERWVHGGGMYRELREQQMAVAVLALWPMGFLAGLTLIGSLGGGFQLRFLAPMLPASSALAGAALAAADPMVLPLGALLLVYGGMHCLFYSVLYAPLFADMPATVFDIIKTILESPYEAPVADVKFMKHFGLSLE